MKQSAQPFNSLTKHQRGASTSEIRSSSSTQPKSLKTTLRKPSPKSLKKRLTTDMHLPEEEKPLCKSNGSTRNLFGTVNIRGYLPQNSLRSGKHILVTESEVGELSSIRSNNTLPHHDCDTIRSSGNEFLRKDASESDLMKLSKDSSDLSLLKSTQSDAFSGSMPAVFGLTKTNNDKHINSCASPRLQNNPSSASVHTVPQENRIEPLTWRGGESRNQTPNFQITAPKDDGNNRTRIEKAKKLLVSSSQSSKSGFKKIFKDNRENSHERNLNSVENRTLLQALLGKSINNTFREALSPRMLNSQSSVTLTSLREKCSLQKIESIARISGKSSINTTATFNKAAEIENIEVFTKTEPEKSLQEVPSPSHSCWLSSTKSIQLNSLGFIGGTDVSFANQTTRGKTSSNQNEKLDPEFRMMLRRIREEKDKLTNKTSRSVSREKSNNIRSSKIERIEEILEPLEECRTDAVVSPKSTKEDFYHRSLMWELARRDRSECIFSPKISEYSGQKLGTNLKREQTHYESPKTSRFRLSGVSENTGAKTARPISANLTNSNWKKNNQCDASREPIHSHQNSQVMLKTPITSPKNRPKSVDINSYSWRREKIVASSQKSGASTDIKGPCINDTFLDCHEMLQKLRDAIAAEADQQKPTKIHPNTEPNQYPVKQDRECAEIVERRVVSPRSPHPTEIGQIQSQKKRIKSLDEKKASTLGDRLQVVEPFLAITKKLEHNSKASPLNFTKAGPLKSNCTHVADTSVTHRALLENQPHRHF